ncbi:unnamed protein product [Mortierella alpina]
MSADLLHFDCSTTVRTHTQSRVTFRATIDSANTCKSDIYYVGHGLELYSAVHVHRCREYHLEQANRLVFVNQHQVQILGTVIPHGPLRKGQPIKSHYEQRKAAKTPCVSASSHFWQSEIRHHGLGKEQLEDATEASADIVKKKANDIKAYKRSAASDPEGVLEQQQE